MLPKTIRFQAQNSTGVAFAAADTLTLTDLYAQLLLATGVISFTAQVTPLAASSGNSLASGGFVNSAAINVDNLGGGGAGTTAGLQFEGQFSASISTATPNGNVNLFMQESPDGGVSWPDNGQGQFVGSINFTATGSKKINVFI